MSNSERKTSLLTDLATGALLTAAYVVLARVGLTIHAVNVFATLVWAPTGLSLAALLLLGPRFWPSITLGAVIVNLWAGAPLGAALGIGAGNTLEALFAVYALRRLPGFRSSLDRVVDVLGLIILAAVCSSAISATIGVGSLVLGGVMAPERVPVTWRAWWLGDAIGDLIVAPLLLTWVTPHEGIRRPSRIPESLALGACLVLASLHRFQSSYGIVSLLGPVLVWAALRFEQRGAARAVFVVTAIAVWATARGQGPFVRDSIVSGLFDLQAFMAVTAGTFLVLGAAISERRRARDEAEAANRSKDRFLATLSHELRTPLTPVLALSSVLEKSGTLPPETRAQLEVVRRNAELEAQLIEDLLDLTRISRGSLRVAAVPVGLAEALEQAVELCQREASSQGVLIEREGEFADVTVRADPARLRQILWNVLKNAVEFSPRGGRIVLRTIRRGAQRVAVEIRDGGVGIEPSELGRIFEPFEDAGPRTRGLGLGLSISRALAEAQGGSLTASSGGPGLGATFRIELEVLPGIAPLPSKVPAASPGLRLQARRVLLVEDHADTLRAAHALLSELGCEVVAASSVREALAAAHDQTFDLVLSDLGLPDGNGLELMMNLREQYGLSGIAVTGYGMEDDLRRSREAGFIDHLVKPITFARLESAIDRFFDERDSPRWVS